jgi:hypothetical protein|tara:strand:+ start:336 stop:548 length:213 start_codon:yes stop_codon:yes gene_type:complete
MQAFCAFLLPMITGSYKIIEKKFNSILKGKHQRDKSKLLARGLLQGLHNLCPDTGWRQKISPLEYLQVKD